MYSARISLVLVTAMACNGTISGPPASTGGGPDGGAGADAEIATSGDGGAERPDGASESTGDAGADAADNGRRALARDASCFFEVADANAEYTLIVGEAGTEYRRLVFEYEVFHGGWRQELFDRPVLNHGLLNVSRVVPDFVGRYILGNAVRMEPPVAGYARKSLLYGRVDLEPRPAGQGYMGYTAWRTSYGFTPGETYRMRIVLDAVAAVQTLIVFHDGVEVARTVGPIPYFEPSLTSSRFELSFGGTESDEREVKAVGWRFCDLKVTGWLN